MEKGVGAEVGKGVGAGVQEGVRAGVQGQVSDRCTTRIVVHPLRLVEGRPQQVREQAREKVW